MFKITLLLFITLLVSNSTPVNGMLSILSYENVNTQLSDQTQIHPIETPSSSSQSSEHSEVKELVSKEKWKKNLKLIQNLGIVLPEQYKPSKVILPVDRDDNMEKNLFDLVLSGIPLNDVTIQNIIRNAIYAIHLTKSTSDNEVFLKCIKESILYSNEIVLSEIFQRFTDPKQSYDSYGLLLEASKYAFRNNKSSLLIKLIPKFSKKWIHEVVEFCWVFAYTYNDYSNLLKLIRKVYRIKTDKSYIETMGLYLNRAHVDITDLLTVEEKNQFNYQYIPR